MVSLLIAFSCLSSPCVVSMLPVHFCRFCLFCLFRALQNLFNKNYVWKVVWFQERGQEVHICAHLEFACPGINKVIYGSLCCSVQQDCTDLYTGVSKQPLHKQMAQHKRAKPSVQASAVHLHLKEKHHSFKDNNENILAREDRWFERGVKKSIYLKLEWPSLNRGGGRNIIHLTLFVQVWQINFLQTDTILNCTRSKQQKAQRVCICVQSAAISKVNTPFLSVILQYFFPPSASLDILHPFSSQIQEF